MASFNQFMQRANQKLKSLVDIDFKTGRVDFKGRRFVAPIARSLISEVKFRAHRAMNLTEEHPIDRNRPNTGRIDELGYYVGRDEKGFLRGGHIPWQYLQDLCASQATKEDKLEHLRHILAKLPADVSFEFQADPYLHDQELVRQVFLDAGFINRPRTTFLYKATPGQDPLETAKPDTRTKVRKARKELEFVPMDADSFFAYYRKNLVDRESWFHLKIDQAVMKEAVEGQNPTAEIIAVCRKSESANGHAPIEAATLCTTGSDGYMKLLRISFRRAAEGNEPEPHQHAYKMVLAEAMRRAAERGVTLDTDGGTPGGITLYTRFGGFEEVQQDRYLRTTPYCAASQLTARLNTAAQTVRNAAAAQVGGRVNAVTQAVRETAATLAARLGLDAP